MSQEVLNIFMAIFYVFAVVFMAIFFSWLKIQRRKNAEAMKRNILSKFSSEIELGAKDVVNIGRAFGLSAHQARQVIYKMAVAGAECNTVIELTQEHHIA